MPAFQYFKYTLDIFNRATQSGFEAFLFPFFFEVNIYIYLRIYIHIHITIHNNIHILRLLLKISNIGAPGWLSQLRVQLLILAQVMVSGS